MDDATRARFWEKVDKTGSNGCWEWTAGCFTPNGYTYGAFVIGRQAFGAHRLSYKLSHGDIPNGFHVHHKCENPLCVNPDHLEALSPKDHTATMTGHCGRRTQCPQGHPYDEENTRVTGGRRRCRACESAYAKANPEKARDRQRRYQQRKRVALTL